MLKIDRQSTVADTLTAAVRALAPHSASPRLDAELLLCKVLEVNRPALFVRSAHLISEVSRVACELLIDRRVKGDPIAYLTGTREFWSLQLAVTPAVLVPRPETELLVELALAHVAPDEACSVLDLGTGSGAIALALAMERPLALVTGVDVSEAALAVARHNAQTLGLSRIRWRAGDWFDAVPGERFDFIVANPPYVAASDPAWRRLTAEPVLALAGGPTGLEALQAIIERAARHLNTGGWLMLEHGSAQAAQVRGMLARHAFSGICTHADFSAQPRVTRATVHP